MIRKAIATTGAATLLLLSVACDTGPEPHTGDTYQGGRVYSRSDRDAVAECVQRMIDDYRDKYDGLRAATKRPAEQSAYAVLLCADELGYLTKEQPPR